jgi:hypothetical protein
VKPYRWTSVVAATAAVIALAVSTPVAAASGYPTGPTPPTAGSSLAAWQAWAGQETAWAESQNWAQVFAPAVPSGCSLDQAGVTMVTTGGADGVPAGLTYGVGSFGWSCPTGTTATSALRARTLEGGGAPRHN